MIPPGRVGIQNNSQQTGTRSTVGPFFMPMPGVRGDAVVKSIRQDRPGIQAIFISGSAAGTSLDRSLEILEEPFEFPDLAHRVRALLDLGRTGSSDSAAD
jgi:DNA-binding response OmpR family regulator